jgi:hypothetical protein
MKFVLADGSIQNLTNIPIKLDFLQLPLEIVVWGGVAVICLFYVKWSLKFLRDIFEM